MSWFWDKLRGALMQLRDQWTRFSLLPEDADTAPSTGFFRAWLISRDYRDLLFSIPALLASCLLVIAAFVAASPRQTDSADTYLQLAAVAQKQGDRRLTQLYLRKSARLSSAESPTTKFRRAQQLHDAGQVDEAVSRMRQLASGDSDGYPPAHQWLIGRYEQDLNQNLRIKDPTESQLRDRQSLLKEVETHCRQLLKHDPDDWQVHNRLTTISLSRGDAEAAMEHFAHVVAVKENARMAYVDLLARNGRTDEAKYHARLAARFHSEALKRNSNDPNWTERHRLRLAEAYLHLEDFQKASKLLLVDGAPPDSPAQRRMLAAVMIAWSDHERGDTPETVIKKLDLLERALRLVPDHPDLIHRISVIASAEGEAGGQARRTLKAILATGHASWIAHFALGTRAYQDNDFAAAETHYEQAYRINPDILMTLNNLAYMLAHREQPDYQRALGLINKAINIQPENPEFRDTRGAVYVQMQRWGDAIADFEFSLKRLPGRPETHQALAKAYRAKGDGELAEMHIRTAESLTKKP